jgi:hypothetical protein
MGFASAREFTASGSPILALAVAGAQTAAMFAVSGAIITGACPALTQVPALRQPQQKSHRAALGLAEVLAHGPR